MITLLKKSSYIKSLWKNGKGETLQIAIDPPNAEVAKNNFSWRISSATVTAANLFSSFSGYERQLVVWQGSGLKLNHTPLLPNSPITFSGETEIQCELLGVDAVIDLGVIYNKEKMQAKLSVEHFLPDSSIHLGKGIHFLFLAEGEECLINKLKLEKGDTLKVVDEETLHIAPGAISPFTFFLISLDTNTIHE